MPPEQTIHDAVVKVCKEVMELKFGCKIIVDLGEYDEVTVLNECGKCTKHKKYTSCNEDCETEDALYVYGGEEMEGYYSLVVEKSEVKEILGSEITLSHILRTIGTDRILRYPEGGASSSGNIVVSVEGNFMNENGLILTNWNLAEDSLSWHATHRPETVAFIGGLIK